MPGEMAAQAHGAAVDLARETVPDAVLDQGLQKHAGDQQVERRRIYVFDHTEFVAEAHHLYGEVIVDK